MACEATDQISKFISGTKDRALPPEVVQKAKLHILDSVAAVISGSQLPPGQFAAKFVSALGARPDALVLGTNILTSTIDAAMANGFSGHADETDDSHLRSRTHPGCSVIPAALAMAEKFGRNGTAFLRAVTTGYEIGTRSTIALGYGPVKTHRHSTHTIASTFGCAAAAAALAETNVQQSAYVLSYAAQQASGVTAWNRDHDHIEKAFDFAGMGARNGVFAALFVHAGATGVTDVMTGTGSFIEAYAEKPKVEELTQGLGETYEILQTSIKKWCVGSPIQAALDSLIYLIDERKLKAEDVERIIAIMPDDRLNVVDNRNIPDICLQHLLALMLVDGTLTFDSSHDFARMKDPAVLAMRAKLDVVPSPELSAAKPSRQAIVQLVLKNGEKLERRTHAVRGTPDNPMPEADVRAKALDLIAPVCGDAQAKSLIDALMNLETVKDMKDLRPLLAGKAA